MKRVKNFSAVVGTLVMGFVVWNLCFNAIDYVYWNTSMSYEMEYFIFGIATVVIAKLTMMTLKAMFSKKSSDSKKKVA